jgi:hypothetical protein
MSDQQLKAEYVRILEGVDPNLLNGNTPGLSGLFLTTTPEGYLDAKNKIMIVGSETRDWNVPKVNAGSLEVYVDDAMTQQRRHLNRQLERSDAKGNSFHNFTRAVASRCGADGLIYANLFCFAWNEGSPIGCPVFKAVKAYSEQLLKAQVEVLKPNIVIFANGMASVKHRRAFFPISGPNTCCKDGKDYRQEKNIPNGQLWEFTLNDRIRAFRIQHPSTIRGSRKAIEARNYLVNHLLPRKVGSQGTDI